MAKNTPTIGPFVEQYTALCTQRGIQGPNWLQNLRKDGIDVFQKTGLPGRKTEAWKYTNLNKLAKIGFALAAPTPQIDTLSAPTLDFEGFRIVFINGRFQPALSQLVGLPEGIEIESLFEKIYREPHLLESRLCRLPASQDMPLTALNMAFAEDGLYLRVAPKTCLEQPIHIIFIGQAPDRAVAFHTRTLMEIGAGASLDVIESHIGCDRESYFSNSFCEIIADTDAHLGHYRLQDDSPQAFNISLTNLDLARGAFYDGFSLQVGALLARNEVRARIGNEDIDCRVNGAYLGTNSQQIDNTTFIQHIEGGSQSRQVFKGVLNDQARGIFQGKILVAPDAQKTDGHQLSRALLLSRSAEMYCKPELEIYADDVKCSHGATVGELEDEAIFYLRSRGIDMENARSILVEGFLSEAIGEITNLTVREAFNGVVHRWLDNERRAES